jgi:hypothetical protein
MQYLRRFKFVFVLLGAWLATVALFLGSANGHGTTSSAAAIQLSKANNGSYPFSISDTDSYTSYLPIVRRDPTPTPFAFFDTFDDPNSGWAVKHFNKNDPFPPGPWATLYGQEIDKDGNLLSNNVYNVKLAPAWNSWVYTAPVVLADTRHFTVELNGKSAQDFMWLSSWGIYFNANADRTKLYTVQIYQDGTNNPSTPPDYIVRRWDDFNGTANSPNITLDNKKRCGRCNPTDYQWNRIVVSRDGDLIYVYLGTPTNMQLQAVFNAPWYTDSGYTGIGVFNGNFEWSDWNRGDKPAFQVDNFFAFPVQYPQ